MRASGLRDLTAQISVFTELRRLDVSRSRDLQVHEDIPWASMTSLRSLDLSECRHLRVSRHQRWSYQSDLLCTVLNCYNAAQCLQPSEAGPSTTAAVGPPRD